jgi:hypothetical protein
MYAGGRPKNRWCLKRGEATQMLLHYFTFFTKSVGNR